MEENENNKNINIDIKSKTIEQVVDKLAVPVYNDLAKKPLQSTGNILTTVLDFFHNSVFYPMQKYNLYAENKLEDYVIELQNRTQVIPPENLVQPRVNILGPTFDALKYNLDEEYIKEIFTNILVSEMDNRKQSRILPSYIEVVKQLSYADTKMLSFFKSLPNFIDILKSLPIMRLKYVNKQSKGFFGVTNNVIAVMDDASFVVIDSVVADNLSRLKLIEIDYSHFIYDKPYDDVFKKIKADKQFKNCSPTSIDLDYSEGALNITDYGMNFIDICLS